MIPSRGLRLASHPIGLGRRRLEAVSARHFSSFSSSPVPHTTAANGLPSRNRFTIPRSCSNLPFSHTNASIRRAGAIRYASSTTPVATVVANASSPPANESIPSSAPPQEIPTSLDAITDLSFDSLHNIPESIGYLHSLGLDFGYGPTSCIQFLLEHVHVYAGTPWWVSISITTILIRAAFAKYFIAAADNAARIQHITPLTEPITMKLAAATRAGQDDVAMQLRAEIQRIHQRAGIKLWKSFVPALQIFTGYGTFRLLRSMSKVPVPGLETGGILWFDNLAVPDPMFLLPLATSGVLHWVLRKGGETGAMNLSPAMKKIFVWGLPGLSFVCTWWLPAAAQLSFFIAGLLSFLQASAFRSPRFRAYFRMMPLPVQTDPSTVTPRSSYAGNMRVLDTRQISGRFEAVSQDPSAKKKGWLGDIGSTLSEAMKTSREKAAEYTERGKAKQEREENLKYEKAREERLREKSAEVERLRQVARLERARAAREAKVAKAPRKQ